MKKRTDYIKKVKKTDLSKFSNKKKVELGILDNFRYEYAELKSETDRLNEIVNHWFDDEFASAKAASAALRDVYLDKNEGLIQSIDVEADYGILQAIESTADELGLPPQDLYGYYDEHWELLEYLADLDDKFNDQESEVFKWFG